MSAKKRSIIFMILITIIWSPTFELTRLLLEKLGPVTIIFLRFLIGIIPIYMVRKYLKIKESIKKEDYKWIVIISMLSILHYLLSNISNINLNTSELIAFSSFQAIINMIFSSLILNMIITPSMSFSVGMASVGAVLTININSIYSRSYIEYLYMFLAIIFWVLYCIIVNKLSRKYKITTILMYQFTLTVLMLFPAIFYESNNFTDITVNNIMQLFILGFFGIGLCFMMNAYSLKNIGTIAVSIFMNFGPILVTILNLLMFNEHLDNMGIIGIIMICIGTLVTLRNVLRDEI